MAKLMLDMLGHQVDTVGNGFEAVAAVTSGSWRSTSDLLGMSDLTEILRRLEAAARAQRDECADLVIELEEEYQRVRQRLAGLEPGAV